MEGEVQRGKAHDLPARKALPANLSLPTLSPRLCVFLSYIERKKDRALIFHQPPVQSLGMGIE